MTEHKRHYTHDYSHVKHKMRSHDPGFTTIRTRMRKFGISEEEAKQMVFTSGRTTLFVNYNGQRLGLTKAVETFLKDNNQVAGKRVGYSQIQKNQKKFGGVQQAFDHWAEFRRKRYGRV